MLIFLPVKITLIDMTTLSALPYEFHQLVSVIDTTFQRNLEHLIHHFIQYSLMYALRLDVVVDPTKRIKLFFVG